MTVHLECRSLVKDFGGFRAVDDVSLSIERNEIRAIIGPNGAGKSTLFNLLTGFYPVTSGRIFCNGADVTDQPAYRRVKRGFSRSFQTPKIFPELSVRQNVYLSLQAHHSRPFELNIFKFRKLDLPAKTEELLSMFALSRYAEHDAGSLSHGDQRILEICMVTALEPELLLLDEPTSGMSETETHRTIELLMQLYEQKPITMVIVEHDMRIVKAVSHRITVMHQGALLAEGTYAEVAANDTVQKAYFGEVR